MMTIGELEKFESHWKRVFAVAAGFLVICLVDLVTLSARGAEAILCYSFGSVAAIAALYAAKKLRDVERADAVVEGELLNAGCHPGLPEIVDPDD